MSKPIPFETIPVPMQPVESSQIKAAGHDPAENRLFVEFHVKDPAKRSVYSYENVTPEHHAAFMAAESKGRHFGAGIKSHPDAHPFRRLNVEPVAP